MKLIIETYFICISYVVARTNLCMSATKSCFIIASLAKRHVTKTAHLFDWWDFNMVCQTKKTKQTNNPRCFYFKSCFYAGFTANAKSSTCASKLHTKLMQIREQRRIIDLLHKWDETHNVFSAKCKIPLNHVYSTSSNNWTPAKNLHEGKTSNKQTTASDIEALFGVNPELHCGVLHVGLVIFVWSLDIKCWQ